MRIYNKNNTHTQNTYFGSQKSSESTQYRQQVDQSSKRVSAAELNQLSVVLRNLRAPAKYLPAHSA